MTSLLCWNLEGIHPTWHDQLGGKFMILGPSKSVQHETTTKQHGAWSSNPLVQCFKHDISLRWGVIVHSKKKYRDFVFFSKHDTMDWGLLIISGLDNKAIQQCLHLLPAYQGAQIKRGRHCKTLSRSSKLWINMLQVDLCPGCFLRNGCQLGFAPKKRTWNPSQHHALHVLLRARMLLCTDCVDGSFCKVFLNLVRYGWNYQFNGVQVQLWCVTLLVA